MDVVLIILQFIFLIGITVAIVLLRNYLPSYAKEKGKNLATKEDIARITKEVEDVKHTYAILLESFRSKEQLRYAAFDRRLEVHQTAFANWWDLLSSVHSDDLFDKVARCRQFWVENNLYLSEDASDAFVNAYEAASNHPMFKDMMRQGDVKKSGEQLRENFRKITQAGDVIRKAVELPPLNASELPESELPKDQED